MAAEMLLQYLWEHRLWKPCGMLTTGGEEVTIIDPGLRNNNSGPDFFNAKIKIGNRIWAGNVEIHVKASDWFRHGHDNDPAYDSVILHAVQVSDTTVTRRDGNIIPQIEIKVSDETISRIASLTDNTSVPCPCAPELAGIPSIYITEWITALGFERLYEKADRVLRYNERLQGDWRATAYVTLARALGFSTNSDPMERLAFATPLPMLLKHRDNNMLIEALLLGQAGFLDKHSRTDETDSYTDELRRHYDFLSRKFGLRQPAAIAWKTGRMRPANFPERRIAALATLITHGFEFGNRFASITSPDEAMELICINLEGYWVNHYRPGKPSRHAPAAFSDNSASSLIINAVAPLIYAFGLTYGNDTCCSRAISLLEHMKSEKNSIIDAFADIGITCRDAFSSQALIQLRRAYCDCRKCLDCRFGHRLVRKTMI
ncbi:MAG: DUF2851 family protein [Odoribacter sp.]|nr:DUF2851 family protein [Odoribacter sp.]